MDRERRKSRRFSGDLPAFLYLSQGRNGPPLCRPVSCYVSDLSRNGAGIITLQIISDGHHLFYEAMDTDHHILQLEIDCAEADGRPEHITFPVRPVWLDRLLIEGQQQPFLIGVQFAEKISKDLLQRLKETGSK